MDRQIKTIKLLNCEVDIIAFLTWGEKEEIQAVVLRGVNVGMDGLNGFNPDSIRESKYKAFEVCIKEIRENGDKRQFSREWIDNLSVEDGDLLYAEVDQVTSPKKKLKNTN
jgi:hypothetical protein